MPPVFDVERFDWAGDRLEVAGRWSGLRGRRFLRPTLDVDVDGESRRLLAVMEHKPWAAEDGEEWIAAFDWEGEPAEIAAMLAVGSDLVLELPPPGKSGAAPRARRKAPTAPAPEPAAPDHAELDVLRAEADVLRRKLEGRDRTVERLEDELRAALADAADARSAGTRGTDNLEREHEELERERDAAVAARDAALGHAETAKRREYEARGALAAAERECQVALAARDEAVRERDESSSSARASVQARMATVGERDAVVAERDDALAKLDALRRERDAARVARDAAQAERPVVPLAADEIERRFPRRFAWRRGEADEEQLWALRMVALTAFGIVCLIVAISIALAA